MLAKDRMEQRPLRSFARRLEPQNGALATMAMCRIGSR